MGKQILIYFSGYVRIDIDEHPGFPVMKNDSGEYIQLKDIQPEELVGDSKYSLSLSNCLENVDDYDLDQFDVTVREE
jgi:hypothetical protein